MFPWILCGILLFLNLLLLGWIHSLHSSIENICAQFDRRLREDTNNLIYVSSRDPHVRRLAAQLCVQLNILRRQRLLYENGDRELKESITNISHDLRTPLTAISGYLELLEREKQAESANCRRYLAHIRNRTEAMKNLTDQLFDYSLAVSVPRLQPAVLSLNGVLEECLAACYFRLTVAGILPQIQMPPRPIRRNLDKAALERVFNNILGNAAKYSAGDLEVILDADGHITFSNSAPELTSVMTERLFDRFYTVETARHSTGLGLSIAKNLTEQMGGTITAICQNGRLVIRLWFPNTEISE